MFGFYRALQEDKMDVTIYTVITIFLAISGMFCGFLTKFQIVHWSGFFGIS